MWGRAFVDFRAGSGPLAPSLARGDPRRGPAWPLSSRQGRVRRAAAGGWPGPGRLPSHVLPVDSAVPPPRAVSLLTPAWHPCPAVIVIGSPRARLCPSPPILYPECLGKGRRAVGAR